MRALALLMLVACGASEPAGPVILHHTDGTSTEIASCAKGCSAPTPDETHPLEDDGLAEAFSQFALEPLGSGTPGLETLLFHREGALDYLAAHPDALPDAHRETLERELSRTDVEVSFRLVDDAGAIRGTAVRVAPLKEKQHIPLEGTGALKRIEINGKTKRVGLQHLWSRW